MFEMFNIFLYLFLIVAYSYHVLIWMTWLYENELYKSLLLLFISSIDTTSPDQGEEGGTVGGWSG